MGTEKFGSGNLFTWEEVFIKLPLHTKHCLPPFLMFILRRDWVERFFLERLIYCKQTCESQAITDST